MRAADDNHPPFGAYVHWPFCRKKCPYCDFNSHVADTIDHDAWRRAYEAEIAADAARFDAAGRPPLTSVFFGGGTPSLMEPTTVEHVLDVLDSHFGVEPDAEITLEANPTSVEAGKLGALRLAGVNRVSLGVQALNDADLAFLGREHSALEALKAVEIAADLFDRFSFDLIYARPGQTLEMWERELNQALVHAGGHLSVYQLTIEPGTQFQTRFERGEFILPDGDGGADLYDLTHAILSEEGLPAYEISNHAAPGHESEHNLLYWRGGEWLAIGPGAHGRMTTSSGRVAYRRHRAPAIWLKKTLEGTNATQTQEILTARQTAEELLMMGLRLSEGVPLDRLSQITETPWQAFLPEQTRADLLDEGMIEISGSRITATPQGRLKLNTVLEYLLA